ncbi:MAG: helix-turn-helix transcriptional regulator [Candidatus Carbobacillus altaicus]|nr:helix-turn-helix transcriptional regulator [Candidatus Carbobacillus altaicus]
MQIGGIIAQLRKNLGWTQAYLAEGICSVSYLSKIENNVIVPNKETVFHLLKKLGHDIDHLVLFGEKEKEIQKKLNAWNDAMTRRQMDEVESLYTTLSTDIKSVVLNLDLYNLFNILSVRYFIIKRNLDQVAVILKHLEQKIDHFSSTTLYHYYQNLGTYYTWQERHEESLKAFEQAQKIAKELKIEDAHLDYQLANLHSRLFHVSHALLYAEKAKRSFSESLNYVRLIDVLIILGINQQQLRFYEESLESYQRALQIIDMTHSEEKRAMVYHNIAYTYYRMGEYAQAESMYLKSIEARQTGENERKANTYYYLSKVYEAMGDFKKARDVIDQAFTLLTEQKEMEMVRYLLLFQRYKLSENIKPDQIKQIEEEIIVYFRHRKLWQYVYDCAEFLSKVYRRQVRRSKVIKMQQIQIDALKQMKQFG